MSSGDRKLAISPAVASGADGQRDETFLFDLAIVVRCIHREQFVGGLQIHPLVENTNRGITVFSEDSEDLQ